MTDDAKTREEMRTEAKADIGLIGLAVMGENLALNVAGKGFRIAVYNRTSDKTSRFVNGRGAGEMIIACYSLKELVEALAKPRRIMMMIKAGSAVDEMIEALLPLTEDGDIFIDGGNSNYHDTIRRTAFLEGKGRFYIGMGVSGGEEGALIGPSLMPGGSVQAWPYVKDIFRSISAKVEDGSACCDWVGSDGAGHFVKMVHNGIEYGDMQLICEAYHLMKVLAGMTDDEMHTVFAAWNETELNSYLIEITRDILAYKDDSGEPLVEKILDAAGQKGTGKWACIAAFDEGVPLPLISEAVYTRSLSSMKEERRKLAALYTGPGKLREDSNGKFSPERQDSTEKQRWTGLTEDIRQALYASKIMSYAQGFMLMKAAALTYGWDLDYGRIALLWRGGCIIRSTFLGKIKEAYDKDPSLRHLLFAPYFKESIEKLVPAWRRVCMKAIECGVPIPAMSSALSFFDGFTSEYLPANLLQAQRDYFGAHTYERVDAPRGKFFHTDWTGHGGDTAATVYNV